MGWNDVLMQSLLWALSLWCETIWALSAAHNMKCDKLAFPHYSVLEVQVQAKRNVRSLFLLSNVCCWMMFVHSLYVSLSARLSAKGRSDHVTALNLLLIYYAFPYFVLFVLLQLTYTKHSQSFEEWGARNPSESKAQTALNTQLFFYSWLCVMSESGNISSSKAHGSSISLKVGWLLSLW